MIRDRLQRGAALVRTNAVELALVALLALGLGILRSGPDADLRAAVEAHAANRFDEARAAFARATADRVDPQVELARALSALADRALVEAEYAAEIAAAYDATVAGRRDFVRGNAAWSRARSAAAETQLMDPDPTSFPRAIGHAEAARDAWIAAALAVPPWPAACRNVERAQRALEALRAAQRIAEEQRRSMAAEPPPQQAPEDPAADARREEQVAEDVALQGDPDALTEAELAALLQRLARVQANKRALREADRRTRAAATGRDW